VIKRRLIRSFFFSLLVVCIGAWAGSYWQSVGVVYFGHSDADAKGGAALSIAHAVKKPIAFLSTGQAYEEIIRFVRICAGLGVTKVRITGGEPLVRKGVPFLISEIAAIPGIEDIGLTTNGVYLGEHLAELKDAGLKRVNISLDTMKKERFAFITGVDAFDDVLSAFTENFLKPGNLVGGFAHYKATHAPRIAIMKGQAPALPPITVPTCVRWAEHDPLFPYDWTERLSETFVNLDLARFLNVGHFPHREDPDRAADEISAFFNRLGWQ